MVFHTQVYSNLWLIVDNTMQSVCTCVFASGVKRKQAHNRPPQLLMTPCARTGLGENRENNHHHIRQKCQAARSIHKATRRIKEDSPLSCLVVRLPSSSVSSATASWVALLLLHVSHVGHTTHVTVAVAAHRHAESGGSEGGLAVAHLRHGWLNWAAVGHVLLAIRIDRRVGSVKSTILSRHGRIVVAHRGWPSVHHILLVLHLLEVGSHRAVWCVVHHVLVVLRE